MENLLLFAGYVFIIVAAIMTLCAMPFVIAALIGRFFDD